jgi:ferredoxin
LKALKNVDSTADIRIAHTARNAYVLALWNDVESLSGQLKNASLFLYLSDNSSKKSKAIPNHLTGRMDLKNVTRDLDMVNTQVFLCGPAGFMDAMYIALVSHGCNERNIHQDTFSSPFKALSENQLQTKSPSHERSLRVRFFDADAPIDAVWTPQTGTLLDLADEIGLNLPANCRSGACRECLQPVDGAVENLIEPVSPAPKGWAYLCCAAPLAALKMGRKNND